MSAKQVMQKCIILSIFLFSITISVFAEGVKGRVVDANNGEPLVGATVTLNKQTTYVKLDGTYQFKNVGVGKYTLTIAYTGYLSESKEVQIASANETKTVDVNLRSTTANLSSVTVSASNKDNDNSIRRLEKVADPIINVLSSKNIQLLPDITVANALQRVSGVTIEKSGSGEARYPIIRGMEKRYINTLVNGIKIPSPDNKNRFIPLDLFPSELLERLEVGKSLTPSLEGDAIGGTINLVMKDAPDHLIVQGNLAGGFNTSFPDQTYSQFDNSTMKYSSPQQIHGSSYVANYTDLPVGHLNYTSLSNPTNSTFGLTVGNRFGKDNKFGFIISGSYQNIYRGTTSNFFLPNSQPGLNNIPLFSDLQLRKYSVQSQRKGVNAKLDYRLNKNNKISLFNTYVHLDDYQTRFIWDTVALNSVVDNSQRSQWTFQSINNTTLQGEHKLSNADKLDWSLAYSVASSKTPDQTSFTHQYAIVATSLTADKLQSMSRLWSSNTDKDVSAYLNYTKNTTLFNRDIELKAGGLIRDKNRDNYYINYSLKPVLGSVYTTINNAPFIFNTGDGSPSLNGNNYTFEEKISAGYVQGKWNLSNRLELLGGFRAENTNQHYETLLTNDVQAKSGTIQYTDVLPSAQMKFALTPNQNLRFAYYRAIARPGFAELIPDGADGEFFKEVGDPVNLKHTVADNIDLRYELYSKGSDQLLFGGFYKDIQNPIEISAVKPQNINSLYLQPVNIGKATNFGFELVATKFIGSFGISANYTYTKSSITNDSLIFSSRNTAGQIVSKRVSETRPLQGQSDNVGNLSFIYKNPKIGFDFQTAIVYTGERISFVSPYAGLNYWQSPTTQLDISFEKKIGKHFSFYGKINNLTDAPMELSLHQSYNSYMAASGSRALALQTDPANSIIIQKDYYRTTYLFGIRYKL
ncbi:MAG: TonB-dependent receptor [Chitinophagia bacterium]|jgi:outer membrane receptor protein involved in Fe transport